MPEVITGSALRWLWVTIVIVALDQTTKLWAETALASGDPIVIFSWFNLILAYNKGAAFSFLAAAGGWQRYFFLGIGLVAVVIIIAWLRRLQSSERVMALGLSLILGGAIGNIIDRALYGHVIDFIQWHYRDWYWPAFNIADSAIMVGAALIILISLRPQRGEKTA